MDEVTNEYTEQKRKHFMCMAADKQANFKVKKKTTIYFILLLQSLQFTNAPTKFQFDRTEFYILLRSYINGTVTFCAKTKG